MSGHRLKKFKPWILALVLLALHGGLGLHSMSGKSATFDEFKHMRNGYIYLRPGVYTKIPAPDELINPPLVNLLTALPLLGLDLTGTETAPPGNEPASAPKTKIDAWKQTFPFDTGHHPDRLLSRSRAPALTISLLAGLLLFIWGRRLYGDGGALCALALYAFSPNILAHARMVTVDLGFAAFALLAVHACWRSAARPGRWRAAWMGLAIGLALLAKHSALVLLPPLILAFLVHRLLPRPTEPGPSDRRWVSTLEHLILAALCAILILWVGCRLCLVPAFSASSGAMETSGLLQSVYEPLRLWLHGVFIVKDASMNAFLFGTLSLTGWWYYFPAAVLIKSTIPALLLGGAALSGALVAAASLRRRSIAVADELFLWLPALFFLAVSMAKGINVGLRHILVIYPLIFLLSGRLWPRTGSLETVISGGTRRVRVVRLALLFLLMVHAAGSLALHPHYLAHFNRLAGGPSNGYRLMVDCNLDWGQDLKLLARYLEEENQAEEFRLAYFGPTPPEVYGIRSRPVTRWNEQHPEPGLYAVSATRLQNLYGFQRNPDRFRWLRDRPPDHQLGHSILIYRISPEEARRLAGEPS